MQNRALSTIAQCHFHSYSRIGSCVLKASVGRVSVDTIGRYGDRHSADISTDTRPICRPSVGRVSVDMNRQACRPTPGRYFTATRPPLGRHSAATRPILYQHSANTKLTWSALGTEIFPALLREAFSGRRPFLVFNSGNIHVFFFQLCLFLVIAFIYDPRYFMMQQHLGIVAFGGSLF